MAENTIWKGSSSQWKNYKVHALFLVTLGVCGWLHWGKPALGPWIFLLAAAAGAWALWSWLLLKTTVYTLTTERLVTTRGLLTKVTESLELYRVRDMQVVQPLLHRMVGLHNIHIVSSDATTPDIILDYLPVSDDLGEVLRKSVEDCRSRKGVRTMDVMNESGEPHTHGDAGAGQAPPIV